MAVVRQLGRQLLPNLPQEEENEEEVLLESPIKAVQRVAGSQRLLRALLATVQWSQSSTLTWRRGFSPCSGSPLFSSSSSSVRAPPPRKAPRRRTPIVTTTREDTSTPERLSGCLCLTIPCTSAKPRVRGFFFLSADFSCLLRSWGAQMCVCPPAGCRQLLRLKAWCFCSLRYRHNPNPLSTSCDYFCIVSWLNPHVTVVNIHKLLATWFCRTRHSLIFTGLGSFGSPPLPTVHGSPPVLFGRAK